MLLVFDLQGRFELHYFSWAGVSYVLVCKSDRHAPYENHLLLQLPILIILRADLPVIVKQLLELFVLTRHNILNDGHKQLRLHSQKTALVNRLLQIPSELSSTYLSISIDC